MAQNITTFILLNVPLESDYKNTLYFNNKTEQENYFRSKAVRTFEFSSYQKKNEPIHCPTTDANGLEAEYDDLIDAGVNYVMYKNSAYTDKWFYAFIKEIEYISDGQVDIHIETDCIQTWLFNYRVKASFVEREHVSDDSIGNHTVPEGLETGEYISNGQVDVDMGEMYIVVATTQAYETKVKGALYGGCYSGLHYMCWRAEEYQSVNYFLDYMDKNAHAEAINSIFMLPKFLVDDIKDYDPNNPEEYGAINGKKIASQTEKLVSKNIPSLSSSGTLDTYFPTNKKLYTFPYNYLLASNNTGGSAIYQYEHFKTTREGFENDCLFNMYGVICPGGSIKLVPKQYKGVTENLEESLNAGKFPICNWTSDVYINWLTQNGVNIPLSLASAGLQMLGGIGMASTGAGALAGAGAIATGSLSIAQTLGQIRQQSFVPPQAEGNINCGDVLRGINKNSFSFYKMSIKKEYAQIIDGYFSMFGYKVNRVKIPNKCHRSRFWYTKTIDVNIDGAIPNNDIQTIKNAYNNGITFWRNPNEIQDYSLSNEIAITEDSVTD